MSFGTSTIDFLFSDPNVLSSASDKVKLFAKIFWKTLVNLRILVLMTQSSLTSQNFAAIPPTK